jgi:hypothetical protein
LQPPSTDVKRTNEYRRNAIIAMLKKDDPADLMANAFDVYEWLEYEIRDLQREESSGKPSYGREAATDIYDGKTATEMLVWFGRVKKAMEEIGVYGPGTSKEVDDYEEDADEEAENDANIRSLVSQDSGGQQLRRLIQAKWMARYDGFHYPPLSFPKGLLKEEAEFYDFLTDDDRSLNTAIVKAMGL